MPEKYLYRDGLPILLRHTGPTTLPQDPPRIGRGPAFLCLHDAGLQSSVFEGLMTDLAPEGGSLAFDLPGHGRSGSLDSLPSIEAMTDCARWVASSCGATRPVLVGHGMGALIALEWARSGDVAALVLCGVGLAMGIDEEAIATMRLVTEGKAPRPFDPKRVCREGGREMMQRAYMEGIKTDPRATLVDLEASRSWSAAFDAKTSGIDCPITVFCGTAEEADAVERGEALATSFAAGSTATVEAAAHFLPLEQPAALAAEIRRVVEAT